MRQFVGIYVPPGWILEKFVPVEEAVASSSRQSAGRSNRSAIPLLFTGVKRPATIDSGGHALHQRAGDQLDGKEDARGRHSRQDIDRPDHRETDRADTVYPSLELATEDFSDTVGSCEIGFSCAYMNTISWASPTTPVPMELNPVWSSSVVRQHQHARQRLANMPWNASILDDIRGQAQRLQRTSVPRTERLGEYREHPRDRAAIQRAERQTKERVDAPEAPSGIPQSFAEHVSMQFELLALAFQADITRVSSFMNGRDVSYHNYPELGFTDGHHPLSHHANNPEKMAKFAAVNTYEISLFGKFLEKLRATPDGDGTLLSSSFGGMSRGNEHSHTGFPIIVAGGGGGTADGGRHVKLPVSPDKGLPNANVLLTIARSFGCELDHVGQSTGTVDL